MSGTLLVRGARQLLTLRGPAEPRRGAALGELGIIRDGAVLIEDGIVVQVGASRRVENLVQAHRSQEIDATGHVVMPGFVDCHARLVGGALLREDDAGGSADAAHETSTGAISAAQALLSASAKRLESRARPFLAAMARHGTTALASQSDNGLDERGELKILRVLAQLNRAPLDLTSTFLTPRSLPAAHSDSAGYLQWLCNELLPGIRRRSLARYAGIRCGDATLGLEQCSDYLKAARGLGFEVKVYAGADAAGDAVRLAVEGGAASVDGLREVGAADVDLLARSDTMAVLLPGDDFHHGWGGAEGWNTRARRLIDGGAAVALGSNFSPGAASTYSMAAIVALACKQLGANAEEAICAATFNAACAIGMGHAAGSIEVGKRADLIVLNASDYRELAGRFGVNLVNRTVKSGVTIFREGKVGGIDRIF